MGTLFTYQFKSLFWRTLFVTFIFTTILWLIQSVRFLEPVIGHGFSAWTFLKFILLLMPFFLSTMLPLSFFIALVASYNAFEKSNEFMMMRNSGLSPRQLFAPAFALAVLLCGFGYYLTLKLMPESYAHFKVMERAISKVDLTAFIETGKFDEISKNITFSVKERSATNVLKGVLLSDHRDPKALRTLTAQTGKVSVTPAGGVYLILESGVRQEQDLPSGQIRSFTFDEYRMNLSALLPQPQVGMASLGERKLEDLFYPTTYFNENHKRELWSEGHHRLITPLYFLSFAFLVALFFLTDRPLAPLTRTVLVIGSMVFVYVLSLVFKYMAVHVPYAVYGMYASVGVPILIGLLFLVKRS